MEGIGGEVHGLVLVKMGDSDGMDSGMYHRQ